MRLDDIDWTSWVAHDVATLMFVIRGGQVLLIRKLRGLGAGKINAPGGRLEAGETLVAAAVRETQEEVGVTPLAPRLRGELRFQFVAGYRLECHVFSADGCDGSVRESDEAMPLWTPLGQIPYGEMWADDALWLPLMLSGRTPFSGRFVFDGERMGDHVLTAHDPAEVVFRRLDELGIETVTHAHVPVFTVEQAKAVRGAGEVGLHTKNLFVRDKSGRRMWLVTVPEDQPVDLAELGARLGAKLSFGSPERLRANLGVEPGSVTPLAVVNDPGNVTLVLDRALADADAVWCHPLTNDRSIRLSGPELVRFAASTGHPPLIA